MNLDMQLMENYFHNHVYLKEFVSANECHRESVRTVPWLRPAGGDSVPRDPADPADPGIVFEKWDFLLENVFQPPPT